MTSASQYILREASPEDNEAIISLINRAFAVEDFFKSAPRINPEMLDEMMQAGKFLLLIENRELVACMFVKITGERGYLGTLSVEPTRQRQGLGAKMMHEAEEYFCEAGCRFLDIRIVSVRPELQEIYSKFGFVKTGTQSAEVIKSATRPVHFINMSKEL